MLWALDTDAPNSFFSKCCDARGLWAQRLFAKVKNTQRKTGRDKSSQTKPPGLCLTPAYNGHKLHIALPGNWAGGPGQDAQCKGGLRSDAKTSRRKYQIWEFTGGTMGHLALCRQSQEGEGLQRPVNWGWKPRGSLHSDLYLIRS